MLNLFIHIFLQNHSLIYRSNEVKMFLSQPPGNQMTSLYEIEQNDYPLEIPQLFNDFFFCIFGQLWGVFFRNRAKLHKKLFVGWNEYFFKILPPMLPLPFSTEPDQGRLWRRCHRLSHLRGWDSRWKLLSCIGLEIDVIEYWLNYNEI